MKSICYMPPNTCIVLVQEGEDFSTTSESGLYVGRAETIKKEIGTIVAIDEKYEQFLGKKVVFRENYGEPRELNGIMYLYFRDFNNSIFFVVEDVKTNES